MKHLLFTFLLLFITAATIAQQLPVNPATVDVNSLNDAQVQRVIQEIQARGLSPEQASALAKANGVSQTQIDQMMARMKQQGTAPGVGTNDPTTGTANEGTTTKYSVPKPATKVSDKTKKIFGYQIFNSPTLTFEPGLNIPVPKNYTLGI